MPQTKQAAKSLRQDIKKAAKNKAARLELKKLIKKTRQAIAAKDAKAVEFVAQAIKKLDKAAQKGLIKKNTAGRTKSRLMKALNKQKS